MSVVERRWDRCARRRALDELLDQASGDRRGKERIACRDRPHRLGELSRWRGLEEEAARAGLHRLVDVVVDVERRQDEDARVEPRALRCRRVASMPSTPGIRTSIRTTSGRRRPASLDRLVPVLGLADDLDVVLAVEDRAEAAAHERLVVGDQDANHVVGRHRKASDDAKAAARQRAGVERPAEHGDALAHADQAVAATSDRVDGDRRRSRPVARRRRRRSGAVTVARASRACLRTFVSASCAIR